ncbi:MAG: magnesium/cobalt transporter CorA [Pirellulales bacterium]|nr:magnesium/cobalt transporter CorA [Pirellulales bacterium]
MHFKKRHPPVGARPGTLVIAQDAPPPKLHVVHYTPDDVREEDVQDIEQLHEALSEDTVTWVDVQGFGDEQTVRRIGEIFSLHSLAIEDVVNVPQRPKAEAYDEQLLVVTRMVRLVERLEIDTEQVSIVLGRNYVITFQERYGDVLDPVRRRIEGNKGAQFRGQKADYLAYAILDTIIDGYYPVLEALGDQLSELEDSVLTEPGPRLLGKLNRTKNMLVNLRRSMWPQRDSVSSLMRDTNPLIAQTTRTYLRDTYDHCVQTTEVIEMYREMITGLMNTYLSSVANRTNDVMKVLTIMASIFIPLTFLAGVYGMNFEHMPELRATWSYPLVWLVMFLLAAGMLLFFRRKGWIGSGQRDMLEDDGSAD